MDKKRDRRSILIKYLGNHKSLTYGELYTRTELAECFDVSTTFVNYKLKGKIVAYDKDFVKIKGVRKIPVLTFKGNFTGLKDGGKYTCAEISKITGIPKNTLHKRLNMKRVVESKHLKPTRKGNSEPLFETLTAQISALWLKRKLI
tara:strand:+ start:4682 stop:5119 length:438 start_codon:yes stop_codon:yes gene_type:complete